MLGTFIAEMALGAQVGCRANPEPVLGKGGACEEATSPRAGTSMQPASHHRGAVYRQLPAAGRAEHPADAPSALAPCFLYPTPLMGGNSLRASPVEFSANPGTDL